VALPNVLRHRHRERRIGCIAGLRRDAILLALELQGGLPLLHSRIDGM
jgi:hypothetical protein